MLIFACYTLLYIRPSSCDSVNFIARKGNSCSVKKVIQMPADRVGSQPYKIEIVDSSCESGLPHTINAETIRMPEGYSQERWATTVEHEKIHLLQRQHPHLWALWYEKLWNFRITNMAPASDPRIPQELLKKRRQNPDIEHKPYAVWKNRYWSFAAFTSDKPTSLLEAKTVWWDQETGEILTGAPPGFSEFFGSPAQDEHPHEIAAQMLANDSGNPERIKELKLLFNAHFPKHS